MLVTLMNLQILSFILQLIDSRKSTILTENIIKTEFWSYFRIYQILREQLGLLGKEEPITNEIAQKRVLKESVAVLGSSRESGLIDCKFFNAKNCEHNNYRAFCIKNLNNYLKNTNISSLNVSLHSMQLGAIAAFTSLQQELRIDINVKCPSSSSPLQLKDIENSSQPPQILVTADAGMFSSCLSNEYTRKLVTWAEPHLIVERDLGRFEPPLIVGEGATGDLIRRKYYSKSKFEYYSVPKQNQLIKNDPDRPFALVLPSHKAKGIIKKNDGLRVSKSDLPSMSLSLYLHNSFNENDLVANSLVKCFMNEFMVIKYNLSKYNVVEWGRVIRRIRNTPGFLENFSRGLYLMPYSMNKIIEKTKTKN